MNKSFTQMKTNIGAELMDTSSNFATLIGRFINRRYYQILRAINWKNIQDSYSFSTVVGTNSYVLPDDFGKEVSCYDSTNDIYLSKMDLTEMFRLNGSTYEDAGAIGSYLIKEDTVKEQPTSASVLAISSSSASDTTQSILIRGISSGVETYETVTLTGVTPVNTTNSYTRVKAISKSAATVGSVTITSNSAAVTLALIPKETLETRYKIIKFDKTPSAVVTIKIPYIIKPLPLSQDYDYPIIDIADLIEEGSLADGWRYKRQFAKSADMEKIFVVHLQEYVQDLFNEPNQVHQFLPATYDNDDLY